MGWDDVVEEYDMALILLSKSRLQLEYMDTETKIRETNFVNESFFIGLSCLLYDTTTRKSRH
jgi:hypothetical protein